MASWVDLDGRKWTVRVNMRTCRDVRQETGWDLPNILNDGMAKLSELVSDKLEFFSVLCVLVADEMKERNTTPEDFGEAHAGDAILGASDAFMEALADFFPGRQSQQLKLLIAKGKEVAAALATKADEELETLDVSTLTNQVLNSLESSV